MEKRKKIYCYVDETGQDAGSKFFIVVAVVVPESPEEARGLLFEIEKQTGIGIVKWHKAEHKRRIAFLENFLKKVPAGLQIYFGRSKKPLPYFVPNFEVIQTALQVFSAEPIQVIVNIDGLDRISAKKITNALRSRNVYLNLIKGVRDESEAMVRLADRWAGCLRFSYLNNVDCERLVKKAKKIGLLKEK